MSLSVPFFGRTTGLEKSISVDGKEFFFVTGGFSKMEFSFIKLLHCVAELQRGQTFFRVENARMILSLRK
jgi:hypothetical protein